MRRLLDLLSPIPFPAWFMRLVGPLNAAFLRRTRGRGPLTSNVLVLTTRGRRTGRQRSTALLFFDYQDHRYVVASFAGVHEPPAWYLNLVADPRVSTEVAGTVTRCVAHVLDEDRAATVWPHLDERYHGFDRYRQRTSRRLPIVELVPDETPASESSTQTQAGTSGSGSSSEPP